VTDFFENPLQLIVSLAVAIFCFLSFMIAVGMTQRESMRKRLLRLAPTQEEAKDFVQRNREGQASPLAVTLEQILKLLGLRPTEYRRINFYRFYRAGVDAVNGPIYFLAWRVFATPVSLLIGWHLVTQEGLKPAMVLAHGLMAIMVFCTAFFGGDMYLKNQRDKRSLKLVRGFPDALDLMLVCTEAGLALDGALARVCKELDRAHPEVCDELNKTRLELTLLNDRARALQNLADRTDLVAFRSLVASLLQTERFGTSLTETLRVLADEYRNTRLMIAEQKAGSLPVKMTVPLITLLLPALFLIIMGPALLQVSETFKK
jgi:tight adherence protein C